MTEGVFRKYLHETLHTLAPTALAAAEWLEGQALSNPLDSALVNLAPSAGWRGGLRGD